MAAKSDPLRRLKRLAGRLEEQQRREACMFLAADVDHWCFTTGHQAERVLSLGEDSPAEVLWADIELFTFALAALRRGIEAATVLASGDGDHFRAILASFDKAIPNAKVARDRLTHFDEWGLKPGGGVTISQERDRVVIQLGAPEVEPGYVRLDVDQAAADGGRYGKATAAALRRVATGS